MTSTTITNIPKPFAHQIAATKFWLSTPRMCNFSDPGTGKTRATLDAIATRTDGGRTLVIAPLSILECSWGEDIKKFTPHLTYSIADARHRKEAFEQETEIVLINHDGVKQLAAQPELLVGFNTVVVDESTAFKNRNSQRSKALMQIVNGMEYRVILTGTPNSNTVTDLWHQIFLLDGGARLGQNFFGFQRTVCNPMVLNTGVRSVTKWVDKENANAMVSTALADIVFRVKFEDVIEIPSNYTRTVEVNLPANVRKLYNEFMRDSIVGLDTGVITAVNAGALARKLLQLLTGAVYDSAGNVHTAYNERYELVLDLVEETDHSVVAFNWRHERVALCALADKRGVRYAVIDGDTPFNARSQIVADFQNGKLQVIFAHPQSAGHGLTLTRGNRTIWASPTYNAEHYQQFCRRIYRAGQSRKTETIRIAAKGTIESDVYQKLEGKLGSMNELLSYAKELYQHSIKQEN
ncbi:SNF2-related protein [Pasteurella testudinis]|uniref:SNF2-related protein n=1 Tax=Pasteurella testudinis TaxID=761 RepID=UPI004058AA47